MRLAKLTMNSGASLCVLPTRVFGVSARSDGTVELLAEPGSCIVLSGTLDKAVAEINAAMKE